MAVIGASNSLGGLAGSNAIARLLVVISGDATPLTTALAKANAEMGGLSRNSSAIGNALTRNLSLPLLALGGYAVKAASDFATATARVAGLTPYLDQTGQSVESLQNELLTLASDPQIIAGPAELADSLFLAGSAGLKVGENINEAMDVVKLSTQGMSAGMGEATDITKVLIASLNNYRGSGLTAARAMDILTVAIKDGTAAPDELAISLGRLLPIAAAAGVTMEATAASVAALTNLGVPTRVATTSLRALFSELLAPTEAAKKRLDEFGVSAVQLRDTLANNGPIAAFELLQRAVHGNVEALHDIIPQIRGFTAFLGLTGSNAKSFVTIMHDMDNATGAFQKALDIVSETPEFQFQKGLQELKIAAIEVGRDLLPIFTQMAKVFQALGSAIGNLPSPLKAALAAFIVFGSVIGPIIKLYSSMVSINSVLGVTSGIAQGAAGSFKALATGFTTMGIASIIAVGSFRSLIAGSTSLITIGSTLIGTLVAVKLALTGLQIIALRGALGGGLLATALGTASGGTFFAIAAGIAAITVVVALLIGAMSHLQDAARDMGTSLLESAKSGETLREALKGIEDDKLRELLSGIAREAGVMGEKVGDAFGAISKGMGEKLVTDLKELAVSSKAFVNSLGGTERANKLIQVIEETTAAGKDLGPALDAAGFSSDEFFDALSDSTTMSRQAGEQMLAQASDAEVLALAYGNLFKANKDYQFAVQATIGAHIADSAAVQAMADKYGVSVDFINKKLNEFGIQAGGMGEAAQDSFITAAAGVDKNGNKITLKMSEMQAAAAELAQGLSDSLTSGFSLFGELPDVVKDFDAIIGKAQEFGRIAVEQASNVKTLLERGVPTGLIDQFISEGPAMVAAFANATTPQLNKVVNAYDLAMGAMDASILEEAVHQEGKGKRMVEGFATAILSASNILPATGTGIIAAVGEGLNAGTLKPKALGLITSFVHTLNTAHGITRAAGSRAAQAFADGIATGDFVGPKGKLLVQQAARGIAANSNLTFREAKNLVQNVADGVDNNKHKVLASGHHVGSMVITGLEDKAAAVVTTGEQFVVNFASGMGHNLALVDHAAQVIANRAKTSLDEALRASPYYVSLPMGEKFVRDFYDGTKRESRKGAAGPAADQIIRKFNDAFLARIPKLNEGLSKLQSLIKDNMKKAFDAGDLEAVKSLEKLGKHIEDHLNKLQDRFADFRKGIRGGFSEFGDFGSLITDQWQEYQDALAQYQDDLKQFQEDQAAFTGEGTAPVAPTAPVSPNFSSVIQHQVDEAKRLARLLTEAASKGLNQVLLSQFASQGEAGANALEELLNNPQLIAELNEASDKIHSVVGRVVDSLGEHYFGKAIDFATQSLLKFSQSIITLVKELVSGLGSKNKELIEELNNLLKSLRQQRSGLLGSGSGNGNGNGSNGNNNPNTNASGSGTNPWDTGWATRTNPVHQTAVVGYTQQGTTIYMSGDLIVQGADKPEETAKAVRRELNRITDRNGGRSGLRGGD